MRRVIILGAATLLLAAGCAAHSPRIAASASEVGCKRAWRISFPDLQLEKDERIVGLQLRITTGRVVALNHIPAAWPMAVDAGYSDRPTVSGSVGHGIGALDTTEEFRGFVTVCEISLEPEFKEAPFAVEATLSTTTDFETTRDHSLTMTDLRLQEVF